jgi:hypothetical protein
MTKKKEEVKKVVSSVPAGVDNWQKRLSEFISNRNFNDAEDIMIKFLSNCGYSKCNDCDCVVGYLKPRKAGDKRSIVMFKPIVIQNRQEEKEVRLYTYTMDEYPEDIVTAKPQNEDDPYCIMKLKDLFGSFKEQNIKYDSAVDAVMLEYM